jgi:hypothetical protein
MLTSSEKSRYTLSTQSAVAYFSLLDILQICEAYGITCHEFLTADFTKDKACDREGVKVLH